MSLPRILALSTLAIVAAILPFTSDVKTQTTLLIVATVVFWATMTLPEYYTSLAFIAAALLLNLAPPDVVFAGFSAKAVWLVFAGIVFGMAVQEHSLGATLFQRLGLLQLTYVRLIWTLALFAFLLAFVLPSAVGRVLVLVPLIKLLADELGLAEKSNERYALYLTAVVGTTLPAFSILTSNVPNIVLLGTVETVLGFTFTYPNYFATNFPVLGLGTFLLGPLCILRAFPGEIPARPGVATADEGDKKTATPEQQRLAIILLTTLALWVTEEVHGIAAAWIGLTMALVCLMPGIGALPPQTLTKLNLGPWLFLTGVIAVGAVARQNGVADILWNWFQTVVPIADMTNFWRYFVLVVFNMVLGLLTTLPAAPSIFIPIVQPIANATGWSEQALAMATVPSFIFFAFPYQAPPLLIGTSLLAVPARVAMRVLVPVFLIGLLVLTPLHYLWGRLIGVYP